MLEKARRNGLMPEEIFSERNKMADDGTLTKVLTYDIIRQTRRPAGLASVDADNCYDRIAHAIASLVFQAFGVPLSASESMLTSIQEMKFFLRTGFGDSTDFATSTLSIRTQGLCQGNGASPAGWAVVSICIINAHKKKGHGAHFACPISKQGSHITGIIFVDDTDLIHFRMDEDQDVIETFYHMQEAITSWGKLLLATGGALKPSKCFFHLISFKWNKAGVWSYDDNEENEEYRARVPLADGSFGDIEHLGVNTPIKTLGSMTCPTGCNKGSIKYMLAKGKAWKDMISAGHQPAECVVHARKTILAESRIRTMRGDGYATGVIGMLDEDILRDTPTGGDQTFSEKRNQTVRYRILWYWVSTPSSGMPLRSTE
jgi:hypothetical protein